MEFLTTAILVIAGLWLLHKLLNNSAITGLLDVAEDTVNAVNHTANNSLKTVVENSEHGRAKHKKKLEKKAKKLGTVMTDKEMLKLLKGKANPKTKSTTETE